MLDKQNNGNGSQDRNLPVESLVSIATGKVIADSRIVARAFGKDHKNVLRDIDNLITSLNKVTAQNWAMGIVEHSDAHPTIPNRSDRYYALDRDAFTLLAMGFTGEEALKWKLKYIAAFNQMEARLKHTSEEATPEFQQYVNKRLHKIYSGGCFDPEDLLLLLFRGKIPYTPDRKYPLFLDESCEALGITPSDSAFDRMPPNQITTLFIDTPRGQQARRAITESALYFLNFTPRAHIITAMAHAILTVAAIWQNLRRGRLYSEDDPLITALDQAIQTATNLAATHLKRS